MQSAGLSFSDTRDMLCNEFLHNEDRISTEAIRRWFKWLDGECRAIPLGESILAIQEMTAFLNAGKPKTKKTK